MTSTSSDRVVLRDATSTSVASIGTPELRAGTWTRLGDSSALGDAATESVLTALADRSREAGRAQGYAAGWAEGRRRAQEQADREAAARSAAEATADTERHTAQAALLSSLEQAVARTGTDLESRYAELTDQAVELAVQIAEAVLQRQLVSVDDPGADAVRRALATVPLTTTATVRMNPDDLATLDRTLVSDRPVTLVGDHSLARGDATAETDSVVVDATIGSAMERVREVLAR